MSQRTRDVRGSHDFWSQGVNPEVASTVLSMRPLGETQMQLPHVRCSTSILATVAAQQITSKLSSLEILLLCPKFLDSARWFSRSLSRVVAVQWLPGLVLSFQSLSHSSLWFILAVGWGHQLSTYAWPLHVAWACAQHGGWVPRGSIPWEPGGSCITFYDLASEVTQSHFYHTPQSTRFKRKARKPPWWEQSKNFADIFFWILFYFFIQQVLISYPFYTY